MPQSRKMLLGKQWKLLLNSASA